MASVLQMWRVTTSPRTGSLRDRVTAVTQQGEDQPARSHVAALGCLLGVISLALPWLTLRSSRLAAGESIGFIETSGLPLALLISALWFLALALSLRPATRKRTYALGVIGASLLPLSLLAAGMGAERLLSDAPPVARASLGGAVWLALLSCYLLVHTSVTSLRDRPLARRLIALAGPMVILLLGLLGVFDSLAISVEFAGNEQRLLRETGRHLLLSMGSVTIGACIAIPLGIAATRNRRAERPIFLVASTIQTVPSLALFGLIMAPLAALSFAYPALREMGIRGVGATPALIALILYSLLPIVHNTYAGLRQVSPAALDAGRGMGMSRRQLSWRVEYPLALPLIGEGVRTATVQSIGNTAVAALIGAGGLGHFIFQGLGQAAPDLILLGALAVIAMALTIDALARILIRILTPEGLRQEEGS